MAHQIMPSSPNSRQLRVDIESGDYSSFEQVRPVSGTPLPQNNMNPHGSGLRNRRRLEMPIANTGSVGDAAQAKADDSAQNSGLAFNPSDSLWGIYLTLAKQKDEEMSENWSGDTEGILVFAGLFSLTVATFWTTSYWSLVPDQSERTVVLLGWISRQLAIISNDTTTPFPISPGLDSFRFTPSRSAIAVNALWTVSLATSLACAVMATLMQRWTRRYIQVSRRPNGLRTQAIIRAYFAKGTEEHYMSFTMALLPAMVHLSVALFFAGLAIFVFVANQTVSYHLMCALALGTFTYLFFTLSSFPSHNSPYQTPYTLPLWMILQIMLLFLSLFPGRWRGNRDKYKDNLVQGMQVALEKSAEVNSKEYEQEALKETLTSLRQDHQFEEFVDAAPSVLRVDKVIDSDMTSALGSLLKQAVGHLVGTCRADIMANGVRKRRLVACYKTIWCLEDLSQDHAEELWTKWMSPRRYPVKDERETLCVEAWKAAQETATNYDGRLALLAEYSQALLAMMWATGRYSTTQDELDEVKDILQYQLDYPSAVPINTPLDPPSNNLMVAITTRFFKAAFRVMEDPLAADGNLHLMFTDAAKSFFEKSLAVSRQDFAQLDFGDWDAGFFSLISLFEDARRPRDQTLLFPNATFRDIRSLYDYVNRLDVSNANRVGVFEPYLRAASVCCFVTLVHTFLDDLWASDREGDQAMSSRMLRACWNLTDILHRVQDAKVLIRCHCARAMLKVGWWKAVHNSLNQPEAMGTGPPLAYRCHSEVSVPYVASAGVQNQDNPDFFLVVADELLSNLVNDQCIYDFKGDSTVADDFEMALRHVLASGSTSTRPSSVLSGSLQQVLRLAQRDGLVRIKSFIDDLDSLDGDGQRWI